MKNIAIETVVGPQDYKAAAQSTWPGYNDFIMGATSDDPIIAEQIVEFRSGKFAEYYNITKHGNEVAENNQKYQRQVFFDKEYKDPHPCRVPWNTMGVSASGDVFICLSPAWVTRFAGNILTATDVYTDILNSEEAQKIRQEMVANRYYYCNNFICSHFNLTSKQNYVSAPTNDESLKPLPFKTDPAYIIDQIPNNLIFDFDFTCNYRCPSCRTKVINTNKHHVIRPINDTIASQVKRLIFDNIGTQPVSIRWAGGEPFISDVYVDLLQYCIDSGKTNIRHIIQTNGSYLKSKSDLVTYLLPHIKELRISFDAATADTYHRVRVNGVWSNLLENVRWVMDLVNRTSASVKITADFVVQEDNYKEIPAFAHLCNELGIENINYQKMWNWDTWPAEELRRRSVWHEEHEKYSEVVGLLEQAKIIQRNR
jgi:molybdenum cofactor biosynthesis enzyme MoaA